MNSTIKKYLRCAARIFCGASIVMLSGCATSPAAEEMEDIPILTIAHYGEGIGIPVIYVNGEWAGNQGGWGGGGSTICCAELSKNHSKPVMVTVKWETCDIRHIKYVNNQHVDPNAQCKEAWHESTVPVHFTEKVPGDNFGLNIHFLPGHIVEAWTSDKGVRKADYPGPKYPRGPAPDYVPLSNEEQNPVKR